LVFGTYGSPLLTPFLGASGEAFSRPRLHIPVFRNLFFGPKKPFLPGFLRISLFSCVFRRNFSQERGFGGGLRNSCFLPLSLEFFAGIPTGQEFLHLQRIPPDSSGFLFPPNAVWLWPATKAGFLLSKY
jgi:hypothetical protein